jgi:hypothetical protein
MAISLSEVETALKLSGYEPKSETSKVIEFFSKRSRQRLYVYKNQGFPGHADVIIHPETDVNAILAIDGIEKNKRVEFRFGSNMAEFPTRMNKGAAPEHFGRALYIYSKTAITELCKVYDKVGL